ncbi:MAG: toxin-antitoxin system TumE family protein [bacterium]
MAEKRIFPGTGFLEIKVYAVPVSKYYPEGIKCSIIFVKVNSNTGKCDSDFLRYDNFNKEGHHKHIEGKKYSYKFISAEKLFEDFNNDAHRLLGFKPIET